jgi:multidrug resistance protein EbrA
MLVNAYALLLLAILSEVFASSMLKAANGFRKLLPSLGVAAGYGAAFYTFSLSLQTLPLGMAYAIWSGLGTALTALVGIAVYKEAFNGKKFWGFVLIIGGVVLLNIANSGAHAAVD